MTSDDLQRQIDYLTASGAASAPWHRAALALFANDGQPTDAEIEAAIDAARCTDPAPFACLRNERNARLTASDRYALPDYPHASEAARQAWLDYRQALRDLPGNTVDPTAPDWPEMPA